MWRVGFRLNEAILHYGAKNTACAAPGRHAVLDHKVRETEARNVPQEVLVPRIPIGIGLVGCP